VVFGVVLTRSQLEGLFDRHDLFGRIDKTLRRALDTARDRGYAEGNLKAVLLVGGSSLIPCVGLHMQRLFGRERVRLQRPLDAVARGAAAFIAGVDVEDHVQHDYAVRHLDPATGRYDYRLILRRGTPYPTSKPLARLLVKASHDGQTQLGLAIFEIDAPSPGSDPAPVELVFDSAGAARLRPQLTDEEEQRRYFWVNEPSPTFLHADPPAAKNEARFEVTFGIDANKRLVITARDLRTHACPLRDQPVIQLT
jgi:molecular chaperone DnaK (HSP70)